LTVLGVHRGGGASTEYLQGGDDKRGPKPNREGVALPDCFSIPRLLFHANVE
jgi:hypothetical protein